MKNNFSKLVNPTIIIFAFLMISMLLFACSQDTQAEYPSWINKLIREFENNPVGNPPLSIWRYEYNGQVVYFIPAHCCDIPSVLYDEDGNIICEPDGGISGEGDGRCPDFFSQRSDEQQVWKDPRSP